MAISLQSEGKGGKKSLMADLNLVPYIDLLTCMVAFLLITAVWTQLARLKVSQNGSGETDGVEPPMTKVVVLVGDEGFNLVVDQDRQTIGKKNGEYDFERLLTELKKVKAGHPDKDRSPPRIPSPLTCSPAPWTWLWPQASRRWRCWTAARPDCESFPD